MREGVTNKGGGLSKKELKRAIHDFPKIKITLTSKN